MLYYCTSVSRDGASRAQYIYTSVAGPTDLTLTRRHGPRGSHK